MIFNLHTDFQPVPYFSLTDLSEKHHNAVATEEKATLHCVLMFLSHIQLTHTWVYYKGTYLEICLEVL